MHVESRNNHLTDDQLLETYLLAEDPGHLNPGHLNPRHLKTCRGCRERFDHLTRSLELAYDDAARESDAVFTPDRLQDQRDRILRRLERQGQSAEVLRFPNRFGSQRAAHRLLGPARRWVAGAAVAGLVAGVFLGFAVDRRVGAPMDNARPGALLMPGTRQYASAQDEQTLSEIEDALSGPSRRVVELRALDAMTMPAELQEVSFIPR